MDLIAAVPFVIKLVIHELTALTGTVAPRIIFTVRRQEVE